MEPLKESGHPTITYVDQAALRRLKEKDDTNNGGHGITAVRTCSFSFDYTFPNTQYIAINQEWTSALSMTTLHPCGINGAL